MIEHLHQVAVHAYYAGELDAGRRACERMLGMKLSPERERLVRRNRTWYTQTLDELVGGRGGRFDIPPARQGWSLFNPTIVAYEDGYVAIVRSSNYSIVNGRYVMPDEDQGVIRTENIVVRLSETMQPLAKPEVIAAADYPRSTYPVDGLEDCRLNVVNGELTASATVRNWGGRDGTCRIATATVLPYAASMCDVAMLDEPFAGRHEKNWMPIVGTAAFLYACYDEGRVATVRRDGWRWLSSITPRPRRSPAAGVAGRSWSTSAAAAGWRWSTRWPTTTADASTSTGSCCSTRAAGGSSAGRRLSRFAKSERSSSRPGWRGVAIIWSPRSACAMPRRGLRR